MARAQEATHEQVETEFRPSDSGWQFRNVEESVRTYKGFVCKRVQTTRWEIWEQDTLVEQGGIASTSGDPQAVCELAVDRLSRIGPHRVEVEVPPQQKPLDMAAWHRAQGEFEYRVDAPSPLMVSACYEDQGEGEYIAVSVERDGEGTIALGRFHDHYLAREFGKEQAHRDAQRQHTAA